MAKDQLARGDNRATFMGGTPKKDDPIEFHGTVATEQVEEPTCMHGVHREAVCVLCSRALQEAQKPAPKTIAELAAKYQPINDRVLLRRVQERNHSLIQRPDAFVQSSDVGEVIAVGEGMVIGGELRPINLQPGDVVRFGHYNAEEIEVEAEDLVLVSAFDVRLKIKG